MSDSKNFLIAFLLSMMVLAGWQFFIVIPQHEEQQRVATLKQQAKPEVVLPADAAATGAQAPEIVIRPRQEAIAAAPRIAILTERLHGSLSLVGGRIDDLSLTKYKDSLAPDAKDVVLLSPSSSQEAYFAEFGWASAGQKVKTPDSQTVWQADHDILTQDQPVTLSWDNGAGLVFAMKISIDDGYLFTIERSVTNHSGEVVELLPYGILNRAYTQDHASAMILHEGPVAVVDDVLEEMTYQDLEEDKKVHHAHVRGWLGMTDKYWLTAIAPDQADSFDMDFRYFYKNNQKRYQTDYLGQPVSVADAAVESSTIRFFAGAKQLSLLEKYGEAYGIPSFDRAVDFGRLYFLTKPIFKLLRLYHGVFENFGIAILMLTITIKLLLFPLANKSYISMHKLKYLQPQLVELKSRYGHDKMQLNKEMMALYKREKVNPASGCLPLILQIPVFFALYKVLYITIEMRHAPFFGWIHDLSAPDPTSVFNLFGLLPWHVPAFLMIGVWPLVLGLTMYLQQRMNPTPADPVQAKVMRILPVVFTFMFAAFPAGLVIYWTWNNILSIAQQWFITRRLPK